MRETLPTRRDTMSEDARIAGHEEEQDEVEAHKKAGKMAANEEPGDEARKEDDDDFEAHRKGGKFV
jgi:hypothetical protein